MKGAFITFEGGEGSGKSTQLKLLGEAFAKKGLPHVITREPGGVESAERIRQLLVTGDADAFGPVSETLLFYAARSEHAERLIKPALTDGKTVLCDRFADSTIVYQGVGKQLSEGFISMLHKLTLGNLAPDLTILLDIDPAAGLKRAASRKGQENRFEEMPEDFHRQVRAGFLAIAGREPKRCIVIDAGAECISIHQQIISAVKGRLGIAL